METEGKHTTLSVVKAVRTRLIFPIPIIINYSIHWIKEKIEIEREGGETVFSTWLYLDLLPQYNLTS